jgi:ABC-type multidrug transport system fused ATPase/permease subunit
MNEVLQGIRMLKFMAWERSFETRIKTIRSNELRWQARNFQIEVGFDCLWAMTPVLVTLISFLHFTLVGGHRLTPAIAFTAVAVFSELRYALSALPETFIQAIQSKRTPAHEPPRAHMLLGFVSCKRIEKYLSLTDVDPVQKYTGNGDIVLTNATITWPRDESSSSVDAAGNRSVAATPKNAFTLADISVRFPQGKLSLICGRLGTSW